MSVWPRVAAISPFGPIFAKELRITSRRRRSYMLRVAYLGLLLLALSMAYAAAGQRGGGVAQQMQQQAELGEAFFGTFAGFCVISMGLLGPVLTSTAIGSERLAKTLPVLLMTPITAWQIVSGKLFSRLLAALTLLGLSLPVLALVRLLGGVELGQMVGVMCLCTSFALCSAAIGLFFSCMMNRAYAVILMSYGVMLFLYAFIPFVLALIVRDSSTAGNSVLEGLLNSHPIMATFYCAMPQGWPRAGFGTGALPPWAVCSIIQVAGTAVLLSLCSLMIRRFARGAGERPAAVSPDAYIPLARTATPVPPPPLDLPAASADPRLNGDASGEGAARPPTLPPTPPAAPPPLPSQRVLPYHAGRTGPARAREVSDNPILWREVRRPLMPKKWMRVAGSIVAVGLLLITYAMLASSNSYRSHNLLADPDEQIGFAIVFAALIWLLAAVFSATAIASEKESDTWTLLLATPLSGRAIVWGKVGGLGRRLVWPMALVVAHFAVFALFGVISPLVVLLVLWVIPTFNSVWVAVGLYLSLRMKKVTSAVMINLMLAVVLYAGTPAVLYIIASVLRINDRVAQHAFWVLPYFYLGAGISGINDNFGYSPWMSRAQSDVGFDLPQGTHSSGWMFLLAVFGFGCAILTAAYFIVAQTAANFDEIVGRAGAHAHTGSFDSDEAVIAPGSTGYPSFVRRLAAGAIDLLIVQGGCMFLGALVGIARLLIGNEYMGRYQGEALLQDYVLDGLFASIVIGWLYFTIFERSRLRATPGKLLLGSFVTDADGRRVSFGQASRRYVAKLGSIAAAGIGYITVLKTPQKRAFHDLMAGTLVLKR